jgi:hypothetical protein
MKTSVAAKTACWADHRTIDLLLALIVTVFSCGLLAVLFVFFIIDILVVFVLFVI